MFLGKLVVGVRDDFGVRIGLVLSGQLLVDDIEDVVHVPDEVELNDGRPDEPFLFPRSGCVLQLKVCLGGGWERGQIRG